MMRHKWWRGNRSIQLTKAKARSILSKVRWRCSPCRGDCEDEARRAEGRGARTLYKMAHVVEVEAYIVFILGMWI